MLNTIKNSIFLEFLKFIYNPYIYHSSSPARKKIYETILLLIFCLLLGIFSSVITSFFINTPKRIDNNINYGTLFFILSCILSPLIEEIAFRLPLIYSRLNLSLSITILSFYIINKFFILKNIFDIENYFILRILISILCGVIFYFISKKHEDILLKIYKNNFKIIYYTSSLIFALLHISNFQSDFSVLLAAPLITLPQLIFGLTAGFVRIKYGFLYCFLIHIINNMIPTFIFYFFFNS